MCLGTWDARSADEPNGGDAVDKHRLKLLDDAVEQGINFIDTADVYQDGGAERLIGRWLRTVDRRTVILATKVGGRTWSGSNGAGVGRKHLREACEASLRRLRTDYVDLYQLHSPDPNTPITETIDALNVLVDSGKVLYWGLSNWPIRAAQSVVEYARGANHAGPVSLQNGLNLLRVAEAPRYQALGDLGLLAYSPLAQGLLSDRQLNGGPAAGSRVANNAWLSERLSLAHDRLQRLSNLAHDHELTLTQLALAWLLHQPVVSSAVIGVSNRRQLAENAAAADVTLSKEMLTIIDQAARPGQRRPGNRPEG
jgi:aryl-alcohol dehydrogenase-like predicted oxidoreductase